jgi:transcriptional regulator with XRE-family HTH domain
MNKGAKNPQKKRRVSGPAPEKGQVFYLLDIDLSKLRKARGKIELTYIAKRIGVTKQRLWNYENGISSIPGAILESLCSLYGVEIDDLIASPSKKYLDIESKIA